MRPRGFSLSELLIALSIFGVLLLLLGLSYAHAVYAWRRTSGRSLATSELGKARQALLEELPNAAEIKTARVPPSLPGGGDDGDAVWFLSAVDPSTGLFKKKSDGTPFWQRNVLYYLVVPKGHDKLYGSSCGGGLGPDNYDDRCPHKMLVRKVIDSGPPTDPTDETSEEKILSDVSSYLTSPQGFNTSAMLGESGVERAEVKAQSLLWMRISPTTSPAWSGEIEVDLRATSFSEARRVSAVGTAPLADSPLTTQYLFSVFPSN